MITDHSTLAHWDHTSRSLIGTSHWCGIVDGEPAFAVSYYGGADLCPEELEDGGDGNSRRAA